MMVIVMMIRFVVDCFCWGKCATLYVRLYRQPTFAPFWERMGHCHRVVRVALPYAQRYSAQQICRKCHIPLQQADDHMAKYPLKTVAEIKKLIDEADLDGLQQLSQTYLRNAFYKVRFSMGNDYGIHGACPSELLGAFYWAHSSTFGTFSSK